MPGALGRQCSFDSAQSVVNRGDIDPELAVAKAKMAELDTMDETLAAVNQVDAQAMLKLSQSIADCLNHGRAAAPINAAEDRTGHG